MNIHLEIQVPPPRAGRQGAPWHLSPGNFLLLYREKRGKEKWEDGQEKKENWKLQQGTEKVENLKWKGEGEITLKMSRVSWEPFFFFAFFFSLFETAKICLGSTKMENSTGKKHIWCREKGFCPPPLRKILLLRHYVIQSVWFWSWQWRQRSFHRMLYHMCINVTLHTFVFKTLW